MSNKEKRYENVLKASEANRGTKFYNNGVEEKKFKEPPAGDEWKPGRLPRSKSHDEKQREGVAKKNAGTIYWNNGQICKKFPASVNPGDGWTKGMLPKK